MSTKPVIINNKEFKYELVTYKAKTEELLEKNLKSKFGQNAIDVLFGSDTEIDVSEFVNNAKKDKQLFKNLLANVEKIVSSTIEKKLVKIYGKKDPPDGKEEEEKGAVKIAQAKSDYKNGA